MSDASGQHRDSLCIPGGTPNTYFSYTATMNSYTNIPPGGTLTLWGVTPVPTNDANTPATSPDPVNTTPNAGAATVPASGAATVTIQVGGFPEPLTAQISAPGL